MASTPRWYSVRTVTHRRDENVYEERITLWYTDHADEAAESALAESAAHAADVGGDDCGLAQVYEPDVGMTGGLRAAADGCEIFSLARVSVLPPGEYLDTFYDTGQEEHVI
jgi:hypothetical protein